MKRVTALLITSALAILPTTVLGSAFEDHTSWQKEPWLETAKGISLGKSVLEMGTGFRFIHATDFFNTSGKIDGGTFWEDIYEDLNDPNSFLGRKQKSRNSYMNKRYDIYTWDLFWRFGFTENWTLWGTIPFVWSAEDQFLEAADLTGGGNWNESRTADFEIGDCQAGVLYQFYRKDDPTLSLGLSLLWKLPTGNEAPGEMDVNITGTGTTDVEISFLGRWQVMRYLSVGWATGYNIRFPGTVQYLMDNHTGFTNAMVDLGDELYIRGDAIVGIEYIALQVLAEFRYRFETQVAVPDFRAETVQWENPRTGEIETETYLLHNGARYEDWDIHELFDPNKELVSSSGYLLTITPRLIVRPLDWLDVTGYVKLHLMGKNSIFLTDKDGDNPSLDNFMPMQALGFNAGGILVGEVGGHVTIRW
jgi:hypothetical protein